VHGLCRGISSGGNEAIQTVLLLGALEYRKAGDQCMAVLAQLAAAV